MKRKLLIPLVLAIVVAGALFMLNRRKTTSTQDHQTTVSTSPDSDAISPILSSKGPYDTSFASLDKRPVPAWFEDAKFGIFIHWGPYSVPAWSPKGSYAEWYQRWLKEKKTYGNVRPGAKEIWQHHAEVYGADRSYYEFGKDFKADDFDPARWARLFEDAGARYMVVTSKHHDGFTLWPSAEADRSWGFPWSSLSAGPKRDLLGELKRAVDKTPVKFGMYYSLYEWYNPLYQKDDKTEYVLTHMLPQMKQLIEDYKPWVFWTDGQWEQPSSTWKSREFVSWLFNQSPVKDQVAINGRWGSDIDKLKGPFLGNFISTEYDGVGDLSRPWEECRGIGYSFGYNRNEDIEDYNTAQTLILMLVDIVSHGGNLLLDIGPDGHGKIPPVMQERLLEIGDWLRINGEAIYGSRRHEVPVQWSAGRRTDGATYKKEKKLSYLGGDFILKQTVQPDPGQAVKEIFFTRKGDTVYAILPTWGKGGKVTLRDFDMKGRKAVLLESGQPLEASQKGGDVELYLPPFHPDRIRSRHAFVVRIS
jgi:alpha-L-fucosidase